MELSKIIKNNFAAAKGTCPFFQSIIFFLVFLQCGFRKCGLLHHMEKGKLKICYFKMTYFQFCVRENT
jgi:hypothetical protein